MVSSNMLLESVIAFALILTVASVIYSLVRLASPKPPQNENKLFTYACGERAPVQKQRITLTLSKYLIYFVIFDSSVLLLAFATIITHGVNMPLLMLYLFMILASNLILLEGGKE